VNKDSDGFVFTLNDKINLKTRTGVQSVNVTR